MNRTRPPSTLTAVVVLAVALPIVTLVLQAVADQWHAPAVLPQAYGTRGLHAVLDDPNVAAGITNSALVAVAATTMALLLGWPIARLLSQSRHRALAVGLLALPLLIPQAAIGTGLSTSLLRLHLNGSLAGITTAHLVQVLPYVTIALLTGFTTQLSQHEEAAVTLGATAWRRLWLISLPALAPTALTAAALGFIVSWSQYGSSLVMGAGTPMLPLTMVPYLRADPQIAAVLTLLFLVPPALVAVIALRPTPSVGAVAAPRVSHIVRPPTRRRLGRPVTEASITEGTLS